jgi:hypothetical protein
VSKKHTRREVLGHAARGTALAGLGGLTGLLWLKANATFAWSINAERCSCACSSISAGISPCVRLPEPSSV